MQTDDFYLLLLTVATFFTYLLLLFINQYIKNLHMRILNTVSGRKATLFSFSYFKGFDELQILGLFFTSIPIIGQILILSQFFHLIKSYTSLMHALKNQYNDFYHCSTCDLHARYWHILKNMDTTAEKLICPHCTAKTLTPAHSLHYKTKSSISPKLSLVGILKFHQSLALNKTFSAKEYERWKELQENKLHQGTDSKTSNLATTERKKSESMHGN